MKGAFDKTFFKFVAGFAGILAIAIIGILAAGYYEMKNDPSVSSVEQGTQTH